MAKRKSKKSKPGLSFEKLVEEIYSDLRTDDAKIQHEDRITGLLSKAIRKIDVSIRWKDVSGAQRLTIIEAKDWNRKIDIPHIDKMASVARDVGASRAILVSKLGFSDTAQTYARNVGIELMRVHHASRGYWTELLKERVVITRLIPEILPSFTFRTGSNGEAPILDGKLGPFKFVSPDGGLSLIDLVGQFVEWWNNEKISHDVELSPKLTTNQEMSILIPGPGEETRWVPVSNFAVQYKVHRTHWVGYLGRNESRGVVDLLNRRIAIPQADLPIEIDNEWVQILDPDSIATSKASLFSVMDPYVESDHFEFSASKIEIRESETGEVAFSGSDPDVGYAKLQPIDLVENVEMPDPA